MPKKLLLADDSVTIQKVVTLTFAQENIKIVAVADGRLALEQVREQQPDIVLADVSLPGIDGYQLCEQIKNDPIVAATPVLLLVGTLEPFDAAEADRVQADGHLIKPIESSDLIRTVRSLTEKAEAESVCAFKNAAQGPAERSSGKAIKNLVTRRTVESFLGASRILELFEGPESIPQPVEHAGSAVGQTAGGAPAEKRKPLPAGSMHIIPFPAAKVGNTGLEPEWLPDDLVDRIVERVIQRMSQEVVREVAWEVVPDLAEMIIRQVLREQTAADGS